MESKRLVGLAVLWTLSLDSEHGPLCEPPWLCSATWRSHHLLRQTQHLPPVTVEIVQMPAVAFILSWHLFSSVLYSAMTSGTTDIKDLLNRKSKKRDCHQTVECNNALWNHRMLAGSIVPSWGHCECAAGECGRSLSCDLCVIVANVRTEGCLLVEMHRSVFLSSDLVMYLFISSTDLLSKLVFVVFKLNIWNTN